MARQFFKNLPDTTTPLIASRFNGLLDGDESMGNVVVESIRAKNMFTGFHTGTYDSSTGTYDPSGAGISTNKIKVVSGESYYLTGIENGITIRILYWNDNTYVTSEAITTLSTGNAITPQGNYLAIQTGANVTYSNVQLEKGTSATPYSPHQNLDEQEIYSTSEVKIGTWIDGKPLYRKVFEITTYATAFNVPTENIERLVDIKGMLQRSDYVNIWQPIPSRLDNAGMSAQFGVITLGNSTNVNVVFGSNWSNSFRRIVFIFEYTKTTD